MLASLICLHPGKTEVDRFGLEIGVFHLGRSKACNFVVKDATVSRRHAKISVTKASIQVEDLNSFNGTSINGERVCGSMALMEGQRLRCGGVAFLLIAKRSIKETAESGSALDTDPCEPSVGVHLDAPILSLAQNRV